MLPPSLGPSALRTEPGVYHYSAWQGISIGVWVGQATLSAVHGILEFGAELRRNYPNGHSSVAFILDKLSAPTPEARDLVERIFSSKSALLCSAVVLEGSGFWASAIRSLIDNTHRTATSSVHLRICTSIDEVISWFPGEHAHATGIVVGAGELRSVLTEARVQNEAVARGLAKP
jgi:hypothetical protein